jgi:hypothetical protein
VWIIRKNVGQAVQLGIGQASRKDVYGNPLLSRVPRFDCKPVQFLDRIVGDGQASFGTAAAVDEDASAEILAGIQNLVRAIGIIQVQRKMEFAGRIEVVDVVNAFRRLTVTLGALGAELAGHRADGIPLQQHKRVLLVWPHPDFQFTLAFEDAQEGFRRGILETLLAEELLQLELLLEPRFQYPLIVLVTLTEGRRFRLGFLRGRVSRLRSLGKHHLRGGARRLRHNGQHAHGKGRSGKTQNTGSGFDCFHGPIT